MLQSGHAALTMSMSSEVSESPSEPESPPLLAPPVWLTCAKHGEVPVGIPLHFGSTGSP